MVAIRSLKEKITSTSTGVQDYYVNSIRETYSDLRSFAFMFEINSRHYPIDERINVPTDLSLSSIRRSNDSALSKGIIISNSNNIPGHEILIVREKLGEFKFRTEYHFIYDSLMLKRITERYSEIKQREKILSIICSKYKVPPRSSDFALMDQYGNKLLVVSQAQFSASFVPLNRKFYQHYSDAVVRKRETQMHSEQLLYKQIEKLF